MGFNVTFLTSLEEEQCPPNSLLNICASYIVNHLDETLLINESPATIKIRKPGLRLPKEVSQTIFNFFDKQALDGEQFSHTLLPLFDQTASCDETAPQLTSVCVQNSGISDENLETLLKTSPAILNISNCVNLTKKTLKSLNTWSKKLRSLTIGNSTQILSGISDELTGPDELLKFTLWNLVTSDEGYFQRLLCKYYNTISYLDLSGCTLLNFEVLTVFQDLQALVLFNVDLTTGEGFFNVVDRLSKNIRHLDISSSNPMTYINPNALLSSLAFSLENLKYLDISGTNLAGSGVAELSAEISCDIPGLNSRVTRPLEFLGLYNSHHDACHRHFIPALNIAGDKDEQQILNACKAFVDRHQVLEKILNDLFHLFRNHQGGPGMLTSLRMILLSMERNPTEKHVQISGSASLFYIVKKELNSHDNQEETILNLQLKQRILKAIVNAMDLHKLDPTMMRNGCLTICHFKIPQDVMFLYEKLVRILLTTLSGANQHEEFVERIAIYLLNSLACQVEGDQKRLVGELGAMQKMLELIGNRLSRDECDDVMEIAWSTMWNVTDETPENCAKFLSSNGMNLFLLCLRKFPNKPELLRNMMGLLGNVAEVEILRVHLMTSEFIGVFYNLLDSRQDNIEVSYNAAGVLAHILSDGESKWTVGIPRREDVKNRMASNIFQWNINSPRNINYRSFTPILRLLEVHHTTECRLWACWALANLTRVYPAKYVPLVLKESGGSGFLEDVQNFAGSERLMEYAAITLKNINDYNLTGTVESTLDG